MAPAIFGLVGVVIGALLAGLMTYAMDERSTKKSGRAAARVILTDLHTNEGLLHQASKDNEWLVLATKPLLIDSWTEYKWQLAQILSDNDWMLVANTFRELESVRLIVAQVPPLAPVDAVGDSVTHARESAERACHALRRYAYDKDAPPMTADPSEDA